MEEAFEVAGHRLTLCPRPDEAQNLGTGVHVWDSARDLARYLEQQRTTLRALRKRGKRMLELGAGCGLAGIASAAVGQPPAALVLTDLPGA